MNNKLNIGQIVSAEEEAKKWTDSVNDIRKDIMIHARDEYDTFLEKCLEPYGIDKMYSARHLGRVRIEEENPHVDGYEAVTYQRFYIDGAYAFTVVFKQKSMDWNEIDTGLLFSYKKVIEQDLVPNEEVINTLKSLMNSTPEAATSSRDKALLKAIAALEEQKKYQWIFTCIGDQKWDDLFEKVEKALGFKLFFWQKTYIMHKNMRHTGITTARILSELLNDTEKMPIDFARSAANRKEQFYRKELLKIKEKLDKAGIETRAVCVWTKEVCE